MLQNLGFENLVIVIVCILISLVIHEFMHAFAGYKLGDTTAHEEGRLTLNPLAHIDPIMTIALPIGTLLLFGAPILAAKPVPFDPYRVKYDEWGAAIIAAAGPLSNLVLAFAAAVIFRSLGFDQAFLRNALDIFITLNVALFVFNMLPIPPLDGSRVLYAFAPESVQDFLRSIEPYGFFIIIALVVMGGLGGILGNLNQMVLDLLP